MATHMLEEPLPRAILDVRNTRRRLRGERAWFWALRAINLVIVGILIVILWFLFERGLAKAVSWEFLSQMPREGMTEGGILPAIVGTLLLTLISMIVALPLGVGTAIYLNEYARDGWLKRVIHLATNNLAGVPSVVFGLFGMALFVKGLDFGTSLLAGGLTLALVALPVIIRTSEEALISVPKDYRHASLALGATRWQTIHRVVLPAGASGILTGSILSVGRVAGETAPILFTAAAYFLPRLPDELQDQVMALPYHLYVISTSGTQIEKSRPIAYGTAVVLLFLVLGMNLLAVALRHRFRKGAKH
ncbi:MAG TPA: phosphate ABC transporter permease PstA [Candidatus Eisenbacteria bacterium]|nr:phosphate ABC transporter permease PstA [Candidatus Eisenbacteria bacterium]